MHNVVPHLEAGWTRLTRGMRSQVGPDTTSAGGLAWGSR